MKNKGLKIGLTSLVLALTFGGLLYTTMAEGTEYYKHVDEVMAQPDQWYGKKLQLHGFVVPNSIDEQAELAGLLVPGPEQRPDRERHLHRRRARHVQERFGSRAQGHAVVRGLRGAAQRRDGEVPVEVRSQAGERDALREVLRRPRMASLGALLLLIAFVLAAYAVAASVAGARRRNSPPDRKRASARSTPSPR